MLSLELEMKFNIAQAREAETQRTNQAQSQEALKPPAAHGQSILTHVLWSSAFPRGRGAHPFRAKRTRSFSLV
jgi:hypothetical protein